MKRFLALLLAAMLVIGDTVPAFAQTPSYTTASDSAYAENVTEMEAVPAEEAGEEMEAVAAGEGEAELLDEAADGIDHDVYWFRITGGAMGYFTVNEGAEELWEVEFQSHDASVSQDCNMLYVGGDVVTAHPDHYGEGDFVFTGWEISYDFHPGEIRNEIHACFDEGIRAEFEVSGNAEGIFTVEVDPDDLLDNDALIIGTMVEARGESLWFSNQVFDGILARIEGKSCEYCFKEWSGIPENGILTENTTITAVFESTDNPVVSVSATEGGAVSPAEDFKVPMYTKVWADGNTLTYQGQKKDSGFSGTVTAEAEAGYQFSGWYLNDGSLRAKLRSDGNYENGFYVVNCDTAFVAKFSKLPDTYRIRAYCKDGGGIVTPTYVMANYGDTFREDGNKLYVGNEVFEATPYYGYKFKRWIGVPQNVTKEDTVWAEFTPIYQSVEISAGEGGRIRTSVTGTVKEGKKLSGKLQLGTYVSYGEDWLKIGSSYYYPSPDAGYEFDHWSFEPALDEKSRIAGDTVIGAVFRVSRPIVTLSCWNGGSTDSAGSIEVAYNTPIRADGKKLYIGDDTVVTAVPKENYVFAGWLNIPESGLITDELTVTAKFVKDGFRVVIGGIYYTKLFVNSVKQTYPSYELEEVRWGTKVETEGNVLRIGDQEFRVEACIGFEVTGWDGIPADGIVTGELYIVPKISVKTWDLNAEAGEGGEIMPYNGRTAYSGRTVSTYAVKMANGGKLSALGRLLLYDVYNRNTGRVYEVFLEAVANEGYRFVRWEGLPDTGKADRDVKVKAVFEPLPGTVTVRVSGNGTTDVEKLTGIPEGTKIYADRNVLYVGEQKITAKPAAGYEFDSWLIPESTLTGYCTVTAEFKQIIYQVNFDSSEGGTTSRAVLDGVVPGTIVRAEGDKVTVGDETVTAIADTGYVFREWTGLPEGGTVDKTGLTVTAVFEIRRQDVTITAEKGGTVDVSCIKDVAYGTEIKADGNQLTSGNTTVTATAGERFDFIGWEGLPEPDEHGCRSIKSDLTIRAVFRPQITGQPKNQEVISGQKASFVVEVNGMAELQYQYQWQFSADGETWADINSATDAKLSVDANSANNQYQYRCLVCYGEKPAVNDAATAVSEAALLTVKENRTVTFDMQGHGEPAGSQSVPEGTAAKEPDPPAAEGYTFEGWYKEASCRNAWNFEWVISKDITLYAKWTENKYTVTYELDGGTNSSKNPKSYTVSTATVTLANPTKKGCTFAGWYSDSEFKTKVTKLTKGSTGNKVFYAKWTETKYTVAYGLNGGTNSSKNPKTYTVSTATITLANPTKTGCTFAGWYSDSKFTAPVSEIPEGSTGNKTFYAKWTENTYTITYKLNGGKEGTRNPETYTVSTPTITLAAPTKTGCSFAGWYSDSKFTTKVTRIAKGSTGNKVFYAKWTETKYTVTYELDGGTNSSKNPKSYTVSTSTITLENPKKTAYTFVGWYSDSEFKTKVTKIAKGSTGNKVFYAKWTETKYTVTYSLNGGTNSSKNPKTYTVSTATITLENPKKTGCTFDGWYSDSKFTAPVSEIPEGSTGNKTFYAKWSENTYTITYKLNGGKEGSKNPETYTVSTPTITLAAPTKTGCSFAGWYSDSKFTTKVTRIAKGSTGNKVFYAKWTETKYTVTYELDGGTNSSKNPKSYTVSTATITLVSPTKTGYTFVGWYADSGFKTKVTKISKGSTGNKTFYAKWKKK